MNHLPQAPENNIRIISNFSKKFRGGYIHLGGGDTSGKFATGVNDTGGKFATGFAGVVDTSSKLPLLSTPLVQIMGIISYC
jgi:hypothetical protein